jgi:hypothetical protein
MAQSIKSTDDFIDFSREVAKQVKKTPEFKEKIVAKANKQLEKLIKGKYLTTRAGSNVLDQRIIKSVKIKPSAANEFDFAVELLSGKSVTVLAHQHTLTIDDNKISDKEIMSNRLKENTILKEFIFK